MPALVGMGSRAIGPLNTALASPNPMVRAGALEALAAISPNDPQTLATVAKISTTDQEPGVRHAAVIALTAFGDAARAALEAAAKDRDPVVADAAREALARMAAR
jgi:HEAT repeat protein